MVQFSPQSWSPYGGSGNRLPSRDPYYNQLHQQAERCGCQRYKDYFRDNCEQIRDRCRQRSPGACHTDKRGCRWECGRPAQTQINQQCATKGSVQAGQYRLDFDKANRSMTVTGNDGISKTYEYKLFEDPHVSKDGKDIGTIQNDLSIRLDDGTRVNLLMGDANDNAPRPGSPTYVNTVTTRTPDGTGALITGISGPRPLNITPLDSSVASGFMENQALGKFGFYAPSHVAIDRQGNMIDESNNRLVVDQAGLNQLDAQQRSNEAAANLYGQGYVPRPTADYYGVPQHRYDDGMRQQVQEQIAHMLRRLQRLQQNYPQFASIGMPMARFDQQTTWQQPYGMVA